MLVAGSPGALGRLAAAQIGTGRGEDVGERLGVAVIGLDDVVATTAGVAMIRAGSDFRAAAAGVPMLCGKALAATLADAEAIAEATDGLLAGTAFDQRHHRAHRAMADVIGAGEIGRSEGNIAVAAEQLAIHKDDLRMTKACRVDPPSDDVPDLAPGYALHHVGGHDEGRACLHDAPDRRLFCGDMFKIGRDATGRSTAISSHKDTPLTHGEPRRYCGVTAPLAVDAVLTPFGYAPDMGREVALTVLDAARARAPGVKRVPLPMQEDAGFPLSWR